MDSGLFSPPSNPRGCSRPAPGGHIKKIQKFPKRSPRNQTRRSCTFHPICREIIMAISQRIYNTFFKKNSVYVSTIFVGSFAFTIGFDQLTTMWWNNHNKGKLWSDIRDKVTAQSNDL
ncbi:hypothetical protein O181_001985 [Austropuccinia psidii MF-1]|uniref:Complex III subunit 9 n=1 Tax=Austropuccinia psidii MF-1 TaxID=1389203 RepID=A0A9Q3BC59_9BASI|nr:hypothetical protein [Austropuccinia psidii MF-1]